MHIGLITTISSTSKVLQSIFSSIVISETYKYCKAFEGNDQTLINYVRMKIEMLHAAATGW